MPECLSDARKDSKASLYAPARGADLVVATAEEEDNIVRGMALDAIFELQISQATKHETTIHSHRIVVYMNRSQLQLMLRNRRGEPWMVS